MKSKYKSFLSGILSIAVTISAIPVVSVDAEENAQLYPYTLFAASSDEGAITVNAGNFCVNGNVATNGTIVSSGNMNINGTREEQTNENMVYVLKKLNHSYFSGESVETYTEDYVIEDLNININNPIDVDGTIDLTGNINLNSGIKAVDDITINGEVKNSNNAVICSETGDINIETSNVSFNGLIYAPYGNIVIDSDNINLNNVVIIGQTITIDCPNANANYSSSMAEFIGNESDIDVELYAMGSYNADVNAIDIEWFTNYTNSSYEVLYSDDNKNYTSIATASNATIYQYLITEDFQKRYFKVSLATNYDEVIESIPFVVTKSENGYMVDLLDSDEDGLPDIYEIILGTDVNLPDTDGDTLTDYQEIYITETDPTIYDSVITGVSDADADNDGDNLSNSIEITMGTNPQKADTDDDGLDDSEEKAYSTDPLNPDSDGDTLPDGDEPHIGLDPTNPKTFSVSDAEYIVKQVITSDSDSLRKINTDSSPYVLSIEIEASGYVEGNLKANGTNYSKAISNSAMLGIAPELKYSRFNNIQNVTLKFNIKSDYIENTLNMYPDDEEFLGIKRFNIFKYFEDLNMLLPIETQFDVDNNLIYADVDELGTYCIMDMEFWLNSFDIPQEEIAPKQKLMSKSKMVINSSFTEEQSKTEFTEEPIDIDLLDTNENNTDVFSQKKSLLKKAKSIPIVNVTPIDVAVIFQTSGKIEKTFIAQKQMIVDDVDLLIEKYGSGNVRFCVITYDLTGAKILESTNNDIWFTDSNALNRTLNKISYQYTSRYTNRGNAFKLLQNNVVFRDNSSKYIIQVMNGLTDVGSMYFDQISTCKKLNINYSEIIPAEYYYKYSDYGKQVSEAINSTNGLNITFSDESTIKVYEHICKYVTPPQMTYGAIIPTGWKKITLKGVLDPNNSVKSDSDDLTDWEEVMTDMISWDNDGSIILPTVQDCINCSDKGYALSGLERFKSAEYTSGMPSSDLEKRFYYVCNSTSILPIHSNPCDEDTDGDALLDGTPQYHWFNSGDTRFRRQIAPTDSDPMAYTGPANLWSTQIDQMKNGIVSHEYGNDRGLEVSPNKKVADFLVANLLKSRNKINKNENNLRKTALLIKKLLKNSTTAGAYITNFVRDENNIAYHSQPDTWQRSFGYNELYDDVFRIGSYMNYGRVDFNVSGDIYSLWTWKGDYWAFQSGAEVGLYIYNDTYYGTDQYDVVDFEVPMTLSLYNYLGSGEYENLYNWVPIIDQWWVTGFDPEYTNPDPNKMVSVASVDLSSHQDLYKAIINIHNTEYFDDLHKEHIIFDNVTKTIWLQWYNKGVE